MTLAAADKIRAVEAYIAAYAKGDLEGIMAVFADGATVEDPVGSPPLVGKPAIRALMSAGVAMGAKLSLLGDIRCAGDYAAFPFVVALDYEGRDTRIEVIDVFRFDDQGKVVEMRAFFGPENIRAA